MLAFLRVKGFAIIDEMDVEFKEGLNVITGETGAGKSIIINALSSLLNARTPADVVRGAAERAEVVAVCFLNGEEYVLRRIIGSQGRSRAFINDNPVAAKGLEELGGLLIHVYGQNESQQLLGKEHYVSMVDRFLHLEAERQALSERVRRLDQLSHALEEKRSAAADRDREIELLSYQLQEIAAERIGPDEEERIRERLKSLKEAARIKSSVESVARGLYEDEQSAHSLLSGSAGLLRPFSGITWIDGLKKRMEDASFDLEDIVQSLREGEKSLDYEPGELEALGDRLATIVRLKEKYAKVHGGIAAFEERAQKRLEEILHLKTNLEELESEKASCEAAVGEMAAALSARRREGARGIEELMTGELSLLSMRGADFRVEIGDKGWIGEDGRDEVEFLLTTNPGEPLKPLRRIASGGELSRIMLAVKKVTGGEEEKTFVFDEIDSGIGGRVAEIVGRRLRELSERRQTICITHLAQIAVYGDHHFVVRKYEEEGATRASIGQVAGHERIEEIARMLGGVQITEKTRLQAEEMLRNAQESGH